jgi:WD40 repeat protein
MNPESMRAEELFEESLRLPAEARTQYIDQACAGNPKLRLQVEERLRTVAGWNEVLATQENPLTHLPIAEGEGSILGRYKLLQQIGEGGFGVVYMAEQTEPVVRRVALKIIKLGMDTRQVIARFEAERQALALMDHPNIAKVLDAGSTESGRPYFVMELVKGIPITRYCDDQRLGTEERLKLFMDVCSAVQHAHQKGIIHRDIKPSNVLVTLHDGVPVPRIIDFGIAKATQSKLTDKTLFTRFEQFLGTPAYMSPEQAEMSGLDVDTRSDIYSLGVLLYELLTGRTPLDTRELLSAGHDEVRRRIREEEPVRPSTRLHTLKAEEQTAVAKRRNTEPRKLGQLIRGELDWIVLKALEKDRTRRYETATALREDVRRYLEHEPVAAVAPTAGYLLRRLVRRHRGVVMAAAAIASILVVATVVSVQQAWVASRAREAERAQRVEAQTERDRALQAEAQAEASALEATRQLYQSLIGQARSLRVARQVGYREDAFAILRSASVLPTPVRDPLELRLEAVACMGDWVGSHPRILASASEGYRFQWLKPSPDGRTVAVSESDNVRERVRMLECSSGQQLGHLEVPGVVWDLAFTPSGDELVVICLPQGGISDPEIAARITQAVAFRLVQTAPNQWSTKGEVSSPGLELLIVEGKRLLGMEAMGNAAVDRRRLQFRQLDDGAVIKQLERGGGRFLFLASLDPRDRYFVSWAETEEGRNVLEVWDWKEETLLREIPTSLARIDQLAFAPDGSHLLVVGAEGAELLALPGFTVVERRAAFFHWATWVSFDISRKWICLPYMQQNRLEIRDFDKGISVACLDTGDGLLGAQFVPEANALLVLKEDKVVQYDLAQSKGRLGLRGHRASVPSVAFSPDGRDLASVGKDGFLRVWDTQTGAELFEGRQPLNGPGQAVCYSFDGRLLCTGDFTTPRIQFWDARSGHLLSEITDRLGPLTWSLQWIQHPVHGSVIIRAAGNSRELAGFSVWRVPSTEEMMLGRTNAVRLHEVQHGPVVWSLLASRDGARIAFAEGDWGAKWRLLVADPFSGSQGSPVAEVWAHSPQALSFSRDGHRLYLALSDQRISEWDLRTGQVRRTIGGRVPVMHYHATCADDRWLAVNSSSLRGVDVYNLESGERRYLLPDREGGIYWFAWQPGAPRLAVARDNGDIEIWNLDEIEQQLIELGLSKTSMAEAELAGGALSAEKTPRQRLN